VKGNIRRSVFFAIFGALISAVFMNSLYIDIPGNRFGFDDRTNAPLRVIVLAILLGAIFYLLTIFGVLSLVSTTFFSIVLAALTWIMPGINAILIRHPRPGPYRKAQSNDYSASDFFGLINNTFLGRPRLVWYGILWLVFIIPVYAAAFFWPVIRGLQRCGIGYPALSNGNGISWALIFIVIGIIIYYVMKFTNKRAPINMERIYQELPYE
jgi:hypothetical protein